MRLGWSIGWSIGCSIGCSIGWSMSHYTICIISRYPIQVVWRWLAIYCVGFRRRGGSNTLDGVTASKRPTRQMECADFIKVCTPVVHTMQLISLTGLGPAVGLVPHAALQMLVYEEIKKWDSDWRKMPKGPLEILIGIYYILYIIDVIIYYRYLYRDTIYLYLYIMPIISIYIHSDTNSFLSSSSSNLTLCASADSTPAQSSFRPFVWGAVSKFIAVCVTYPLQVITRFYKNSNIFDFRFYARGNRCWTLLLAVRILQK